MGQRRPGQLALIALAAAAAGCGGNDSEAQRACEEDARKAAEAIVIDVMYENGDLGPKDEVRAELEERAGEGEELFDPQGHLRPWPELDTAERTTLVNFWTSNRIHALTGEARDRARSFVEPDC